MTHSRVEYDKQHGIRHAKGERYTKKQLETCKVRQDYMPLSKQVNRLLRMSNDIFDSFEGESYTDEVEQRVDPTRDPDFDLVDYGNLRDGLKARKKDVQKGNKKADGNRAARSGSRPSPTGPGDGPEERSDKDPEPGPGPRDKGTVENSQ